MNPTLIAALVSLAIGFGGGWASNGWRLGSEIAQMQAQAAIDLSNSLKDALDQTVKYQRTKDEAIKKAERRALDNMRLAAAAGAESDKLRMQLSDAANNIPRATHTSLVAHATTLNAVFSECQRGYEAMGRNAQGHASDVQTLMDAWPKQEPK